MQRKRPANAGKRKVTRKRITFRPKSTLVVREFKRLAKPPVVKYPSTLENLGQSQLRYEAAKKQGKKSHRKKAHDPREATRGTPLVNARPKPFGGGTSATRRGLRWDARSAIQPAEQDAGHATKKRSRK